MKFLPKDYMDVVEHAKMALAAIEAVDRSSIEARPTPVYGLASSISHFIKWAEAPPGHDWMPILTDSGSEAHHCATCDTFRIRDPFDNKKSIYIRIDESGRQQTTWDDPGCLGYE